MKPLSTHLLARLEIACKLRNNTFFFCLMSLNRVISTRNYTGIHKVHVVASKGFNLQTDAYGKRQSPKYQDNI